MNDVAASCVMRRRGVGPFRRLRSRQACPPPRVKNARMLRLLLAVIPIAALTVAAPLVNRIEPRIFGLPFFLCWTVGWALLAPAFLWTISRLERRP